MPPHRPLIELFQSQSCNSCPPTNSALISLLRQHPQNQQQQQPPTKPLLLTYHVTYWNHLSWTDTFSHPSFDQRQYEYVRKLGLRSAYTPMVVVNGRAVGVGNTVGAVQKLLGQAESLHGGSDGGEEVEVDVVSREGEEAVVSVRQERRGGGQKREGLVLKLVTYDPREVDVNVKKGENAGKTLPHVNVVRKVVTVSEMGGEETERVVVVRKVEGGLKQVVLVQRGVGGGVVAFCELD